MSILKSVWSCMIVCMFMHSPCMFTSSGEYRSLLDRVREQVGRSARVNLSGRIPHRGTPTQASRRLLPLRSLPLEAEAGEDAGDVGLVEA
jgi:hypothetical protein